MPTIVDILRSDPEPLPVWLAGGPPQFNREKFFASRTVYYPGSGNDGQPVKLCALAHAAHTFLYVDQGVERETLAERLRDPEQSFRGYTIAYQEELTEEILRPGGWIPHVSRGAVGSSVHFREGFTTPFGWFVVLDREGIGEDHGPERLAILFIGGDGIASYDALYCQEDCTPPPFLAVIQDHGFSGNYSHFGYGGLLECIARERRVLPEYLLVANNSEPWQDYVDTCASAEPGGMWAYPRHLFRRVPARGPGTEP